MATLVEFREQYPQYAEVPDVKLADALHQKFYSQIPKGEFYQKIGLGMAALIPGAEGVVTPAPPPAPGLQDRLMGLVETPAIVAGKAGKMLAPAVGAVAGGLTKRAAQFGLTKQTPEDVSGMVTRAIQGQMYEPRTQTGESIVSGIGAGIEALPPTLGSAGVKLGVLSAPALNQLAGAVAPAAQRAAKPVANLLRKPEQDMTGMGAASTSEELQRAERSARMGIPLTKGERSQGLGQQQFESETAKLYPEGAGAPLLRLKEQQKSSILNKFEQMSQETGAEFADPSAYRKVGIIVDKALSAEYDTKYKAYKAAYQKADDAGETLERVPYQKIVNLVESQTPTMRQKLDPILDAVNESLLMNDPGKTGTITIRALEDIYQQVGKVKDSPHAKQLKSLITEAQDGAGGELYRYARAQRKLLAKDFEDAGRVSSLLTTKGADRKVALSDVFDHIVLDGSKEEMQTVARLLKRAGAGGQQAWAEVQGQTIQYLKDQLTKNASGQLSFAKLKSAIDGLEREDKLVYMFGKQGRQDILDLRDTIQDVLVKQPGAVNYSNTGSMVLRGLEQLEKMHVPMASKAAQMKREAETAKRVKEAVTQPNTLAPGQKNQNALSP